MMVVLCGTTGILAAEKPAEKPAQEKVSQEKPSPEKAGQKAAPPKPPAKPPARPEAKSAPTAASPSARAPKSDAEEGGEDEEADETGKDDRKGASGGLPIPRFVSLRTKPVNLRTGPGVRYPVDWVYVRRHLPVEVIGEFDTWRQIRDPDGAEGWVHQSMISGKRAAIVTKEPRALKRAGEAAADVIATLEQGVIVNLQRCPAETDYCRVEVNGLQGWLKRDQFWGVYPDETLQ